MNEQDPDPADETIGRPAAQGAGSVPARRPLAETQGARTSGPDEPTIGLDQTASYAPGRTEPTPPPPGGAGAAAATRPLAPKEGQVIANRFVVHRMLGQGGMGRVYAVQDRKIEGRDVALKVLLPKYSKNAQFRKLFFQEVRAAQEFVSEYICQVRDTGETDDGSLFFTMDMVEGESLRALLDREKLLGARHALEVTRQVLLGLQSGHEKGFVHRDIKPSNVMLVARVPKTDTNPYGVGVRLLDFGIAGLATEIDERSRAGTVMYMSPEQAAGERLDPRSDLFAVGVLMFEMLSGHRPFDGSTTRALVQSVLETNLTARLGEIPNLPKPVRKLLERALQKDRNKRFQSASEFADAIARCSAYRLPKEVPAWAYAAIVVAAGGAGVMGWFFSGSAGKIAELQERVNGAKAEMLAEVRKAEAAKDVELAGLAERLRLSDESNAKLKLDLASGVQREGDARTAKEAAEANSANLQTQLNNVQGQLAGMREERAALSSRVTSLESDFRVLGVENERLKAERDEARLAASSKGKVAAAFDTLADLVERGFGEIALSSLADYEKRAVFDEGTGRLQPYLRATVQACAHVEKHLKSLEAAQGPRLGEIRSALDQIAVAKREFDALQVSSGEWSTVVLGDGTEKPNRLAVAGRLIEQLRQQASSQMVASQSEDEASWKAVALDGLGRSPKAVFDHFDRYGCKEHLSAAAARLVASLQAGAAQGEALDLAGLRGFVALDEWVKRLGQEQFTLEPGAALDLRLFELAQRWYDSNTANDQFDWTTVRLSAGRGEPIGWRHVLKLQHELARPDSGYPLRFKGLTLSRQVDEHGDVSWVEDEDRSASDAADAWEIRRRIADADGQFSPDASTLSLERVDGEIRVRSGSVVYLDLNSLGAHVHAEPLPQLYQGAVPQSLLPAQLVDAFRRVYSGVEGELCLVVTDRGTTRWYSPKFGLLRERIQGGWTRELVYWRGTL